MKLKYIIQTCVLLISIKCMREVRGSPVTGIVETVESYCFKKDNDGMPWPLYRIRDLENSIIHGVHCADFIKGPKGLVAHEAKNTFHYQHCVKLLNLVQGYFATNPGFSVPQPLCADLMEAYRQQNCKGQKLPRGEPCTATLRYNVGYKKFGDIIPIANSRDEVFDLMQGMNIGHVVEKVDKGEPKTSQESDYISQLDDELSIRIAAFGLYCWLGGESIPLAKLQTILAYTA